jgi:hypothetical protein
LEKSNLALLSHAVAFPSLSANKSFMPLLVAENGWCNALVGNAWKSAIVGELHVFLTAVFYKMPPAIQVTTDYRRAVAGVLG